MLPQRALYWENRATLILSDLHLGKAQDFQAAGIPIPATVHFEDLARLEGLMRALRPERVFVLGDFVHSNRGEHPELAAEFNRVRGLSEWILALGNHDQRAKQRLAQWNFNAIVDDVVEDSITFCHDESSCAGVSVNGHVHPVVKLGNSRERLRLPCFVVGAKRLLLPSFGAFTGGFEIEPRAAERVFAVTEHEVVEVPRRATRSRETVSAIKKSKHSIGK
jgi:DNA ligase-associated metallophosphoesterase